MSGDAFMRGRRAMSMLQLGTDPKETPPRMRRLKSAGDVGLLKNPRTFQHRLSMLPPTCDGSFMSVMDLQPLQKQQPVQRMRTLPQRARTVEFVPQKLFWPAATLSLVLGVLSIAPYNLILASDAGSPLFISFVTHIFFVAVNVPKIRTLLFRQQIPLKYHAGCVVLGYLFNALKSDASSRLAPSVAAVLLNLQMLVGMLVQYLLLNHRYSLAQLSGCGIVTAGVAMAGRAASAQKSSGASGSEDVVTGSLEMIGALLALNLLQILIKTAFQRYGEHVDEQIFMQHLCGLPLFLLGKQWSQIGPRMHAWAVGGDWWRALLLLCNIALTFGSRAAGGQMAGRAPNLLIVQLVETLTKFLSLVLTALLSAPPLPPMGFWMGAAVLVFGTIQFLSASDSSEGKANGGGDDGSDDSKDD